MRRAVRGKDASITKEASPLVAEGRVFVGDLSGMFYALDAASGEKRWTHETGARIMGSANWAPAAGNRPAVVLVGSYDRFLYAFEAASGTLRWRHETENYINGTPALTDQCAVVGGCDACLHIIDLKTGDNAGPCIDTGSYIAGSAAVDGGHIFVGHYGNQLLCADTRGEDGILWEYGDEDEGSPFFASPAVGTRHVFAGSRDRKMHCVDRRTGAAVWQFETRGEVNSSPVVGEKHVVFGSDDGRLYIVRREDGKKVWSYLVGAPVKSSPAVVGGQIIVGASDGRVYVFGPKPPSQAQE